VFDIGLFEFVTLAVIALLVFGPDRLPRVTAQAVHWLRQIREHAQAARQQITESIDVDQGMLKDLADLHPRNIARSVIEPVTEVKEAAEGAIAEVRNPFPGAPPQSGPGTSALPPAPAPFDPDAT
jgi:sec-independent protein translocase protein TatB